jgi:hypothetical protein
MTLTSYTCPSLRERLASPNTSNGPNRLSVLTGKPAYPRPGGEFSPPAVGLRTPTEGAKEARRYLASHHRVSEWQTMVASHRHDDVTAIVKSASQRARQIYGRYGTGLGGHSEPRHGECDAVSNAARTKAAAFATIRANRGCFGGIRQRPIIRD